MRPFTIILIIAGFIVILMAGNVAAGKSIQDVFIFSPDELDPGSKAAFRVVVMEARGLNDSSPVRGARVKITIEGKSGSYLLLDSLTNLQGTVNRAVEVPELDPGEDHELVIRVSSHLGKDERRHRVRVTPRFRILLSSDKPLYQPGQLVHLRAVALKISNLNPVARAEIMLEVEDPQGNKVFKRTGRTDHFGLFAADFELADEIKLGDYQIRATVGGRKAEKTVTVKRYVLPKFKVALETNKRYYRPSEVVTGIVSANYFFGKPVDSGEVKVIAETFDVEFHTLAQVKGKTDNDGNFEFVIKLPDHFVGQPLKKGDAFVKLEAEVTDLARHKETATVQRKVAGADLRLELVPEAGRIIPGVENKIYAVVTAPDDQPVRAKVWLSLSAEFQAGSRGFLSESDDTGIAEFSFIPRKEDSRRNGNNNYVLTLNAKAEDHQGRQVDISRKLSSSSLKDSVLLRTDQSIYRSGDDIKVHVLSGFSAGTVYLDLIRNRRTVVTRALEMKDGRASDLISLGPDLFGTLEIHAYVILPSGEIMRDARIVYVERSDELNISVSLDKDSYRPGEQARLLFKTTAKNGQPHAAALGISVVDESVFAIQEMQPGLLKVYFTLEKELAKPRYEIHFVPGGRTLESLILEKQEVGEKRDKVMRVLMAGVAKPTNQSWQENPAGKRMQTERANIQQFGRHFFVYAQNHQFIERSIAGGWSYIPGLAEIMVQEKAVNQTYTLDSFGNLYDPAILTHINPQLDLSTIASGIASYRVLMIYQALHRYYQEEEKSWLDKLFTRDLELEDLPDDIVEVLVEKKYLEMSTAIDPWGKSYIVTRPDGSRRNPYHRLFKKFEIRSAGPDGKIGTEDDITDPYLFARVPYLNQMGYGRWVAEDEGFFKRVLRFGASQFVGREDLVFNQAMPLPAAADKAGEILPKSETGTGGKKPIRIREYFPETLLWQPALITDRWGQAELTIPLADSITTWRLSALGHSSMGYLGSTTSGLRVFQDFFVDIDFPVQLTQGDEVEVPIAVYNYLPGPQTVTLELRQYKGFRLLSEPTQSLTLSGGQVDVRYFRLKATKVGKQSLTVYAVGSKLSDAVKRSVLVVPDGQRLEVIKNGRLTGPLSETIHIPKFAIAEASRIMVKFYPGVFAQVLEGMDGIFRMPSGCFEQTTSTTYPNVMALAYMKKTGTASPEIQMKAESFINIGYQRLLSFEVPGGGFEWFGKSPAHKVLTAYGLMEFYDMSQVYPIDDSVVSRTQQWLVEQQEANGSWEPVKHWLETLSGEDFSRSLELNTAYITWALAETGYKGEAVQNGTLFLKDHLRKIDDAYTLALAANAMVAVDPDDKEAKDLLRRLEGLKIEDKKTGTVHWKPKGETAVHGGGNSAMIETTSLILYAMIKARMHPTTVNKGLAWIAQQKDGFGTFQSTQATILAFKVLLAAEEGRAPDVEGDIAVTMAGREEALRITPEDSEVLRVIDFKTQTASGSNKLAIDAPEDMGLMYQVMGIYYVPWNKVRKLAQRPLLSLDLDYDRTNLKIEDTLTAKVTAEYHGEKGTDMVILDLGIPPGFKLLPEAWEKLRREEVIEKYTATGRQITVYIRKMETGKPLTFSYPLKAKFPVKAQTPKSTAYEYYNPDTRVEVRPVQIEVARTR